MNGLHTEPDETILRTIAKGAAAGMAAALITSLFQAWISASPLGTPTEEQPTSPTEVLAGKIFYGLTGGELKGPLEAAGGAAVHYATGAGLGAAYAALTRRWPDISAARGAAFGLTVWATVEETGLALLKLKPPPWRVKPAEHAFAAASHLVFGLALDAIVSTLRTVGATSEPDSSGTS